MGGWRPYTEPRTEGPAAHRPFRIFATGDSTASIYATDTAPRTGWAQALPVFTGHGVTIVDRALSGASTKSYEDAGLLDAVLRDIRPGDWLLISFGHNDEKTTDPTRGTDPYTTFQTYLRTFLDGARQHGAHPVLVTPVERRRFDATGHAKASHGDYPAAMRALAAAEGVPLVDLQALSLALWEKLGPEGTTSCFLYADAGTNPNYPTGVADNTHFQAHGAIEVARLVAAELRTQHLLPAGTWHGLDREVPDSAIVFPPELPDLT
ncbi:rhamnogalacturonan acetylesterase [Streptomyces sp. NBC_01465]|uniref:rhamnogalacturonan acetylesterase n=1 Tax=Streptomyces sp. NBC_01465 TaxID=2903878 RepID=UPI002E32911A|nr:rhamnogalacturonan acetylesterase [Streptomyces sp. NBC_01465]